MSQDDRDYERDPRLVEAEIRKLDAEAREAEARSKYLDEQARREKANADAAEASAKMSDIRLDEAKIGLKSRQMSYTDQLRYSQQGKIRHDATMRQEEERKALDYNHGIFRFREAVNSRSVDSLISRLAIWSRTHEGADLEIIFSSPGGSVFDGKELYDYLKELRGQGHKLTTGARGMAASKAGILLQAGEVRWIGAESLLMIHEISQSFMFTSMKTSEQRDNVKTLEMLEAQVIDIFMERANLKKITREGFVDKWHKTDWWLPASEALELGFIDEVR